MSLQMLDTRLISRDQQLSLQSYLRTEGSFDGTAFATDVGAASRQLLGTAQTQWLQQQMQASTATWRVLGQQVQMGRMQVPTPILFNLLSGGTEGVSLRGYASLVQKAQQAQTAPGTLTAQEQAVLAQPALPYNLDAWDGYAAARESVLGLARTVDKNVVVRACDTQNAWANDLATLAAIEPVSNSPRLRSARRASRLTCPTSIRRNSRARCSGSSVRCSGPTRTGAASWS